MGEEVNQDLDAGRVCMCVRQGSMVIMLISHFLSECWKNTFFFHQPGRLLPPMLPTFMLQQGWSERQKSGNQVNYGRRLADKSERKGEKVGILGRGSGTVLLFFSPIIWVNTAGSLPHWPDPATCFLGSAVTILTRSVLTRPSLFSATQT